MNGRKIFFVCLMLIFLSAIPFAHAEVSTLLPLRIVSFSASQTCVRPGEMIEISWQTENADEVFLNGKSVGTSGTVSWMPQAGKKFSLTARNAGSVLNKNLFVYVKAVKWQDQIQEFPFSKAPVEAVASNSAGLIFLSEGLIYKSDFQGRAEQLNPNPLVSEWTTVAADPKNSSVLYAATQGRVYRSEDGGKTWPGVIPVRALGSDLDIHTLYIPSENPDIIYIGFDSGVYRADLQAQSLELMTSLNGIDVFFLGSAGSHLAAASPKELVLSSDNGQNWKKISGIEGEITSLNLHANQNQFWVGTTMGLYLGDYQSSELTKVDGIKDVVHDISVEDKNIFVATSSGVYHFQDNWQKICESEIFFIVDGTKKIFATGQNLLTVNSVPVYSNTCPNAPGSTLRPASPELQRGEQARGVSIQIGHGEPGLW